MSAILVGVGISSSAAGDDDPLAQALEAEALGFDFVSASDHPIGEHASYETLTLLTWIAARTNRIGVATRVIGVPFRRPGMIAKSAESLHRLSGGRLILGLGGGYSDAEIRSLGAPVPSPREKVDGLADAIEIMRGAWTGDHVTYHGPVHEVDELMIRPTPIRPIPVWLGTYGSRALAVTGIRRSPTLPDVPTIDESGVSGYEATSWNALLAPRATSRELVQRINAALVESLHAVKVRTIITSAGADAVGSSPEQLASFLNEEIVKWGKVVKAANISPE